jgi:hypothetical protein
MEFLLIGAVTAGLGYLLSNDTDNDHQQVSVHEGLSQRGDYQLYGKDDLQQNRMREQIAASKLYKESQNPSYTNVVSPVYLEQDTTQRLSNASFLNDTETPTDLSFHGKFPFFRGDRPEAFDTEDKMEHFTSPNNYKQKEVVTGKPIYQNTGYQNDAVGQVLDRLISTQPDKRPNEHSIQEQRIGPDQKLTSYRADDPTVDERRGVLNPLRDGRNPEQIKFLPFELSKRPIAPTESKLRPIKSQDISDFTIKGSSTKGMVLKAEFTPTLLGLKSEFVEKAADRIGETAIPRGPDNLMAPTATDGTIQRSVAPLDTIKGSRTGARVADLQDLPKTTVRETTLAINTVGTKGSRTAGHFTSAQNPVKSTIRETTLTLNAVNPAGSRVAVDINRSGIYSAEINALKTAQITQYPPISVDDSRIGNARASVSAGESYTGSLRGSAGSDVLQGRARTNADRGDVNISPDRRRTNNEYSRDIDEHRANVLQRQNNPFNIDINSGNYVN